MNKKLILILVVSLTSLIYAQWEYVTPPTFANGAYELQTYDGNLYLLTLNQDLYKYNNADISWINLTNGFINNGSFGLFNRSTQITGNNIFVATSNGIYVSPDNGSTWQSDTTGIVKGSHPINIPFLYTDGVKIFTTRLYPGNGFFVKDASPGEWIRIDDSVIGASLGGVVAGVCKIDNMYYAVNSFGGFFESSDGLNWTSKTTNGLPTSIPFLNGHTNKMTVMGSQILVAAEDGLFKSEDLGSNWIRIDMDFAKFEQFGTVQIRSVHYDGTNLYASVSSDDSAYVSTDMGESWSDISSGLLSKIQSMVTYDGALWTAQASIENALATYNSATSTNEELTIPLKYELAQNYPNPFNPSTKISFSIIESNYVNLNIYSSLGEKIETLVSKKLNGGQHTFEFNATNLTSGVYFYELKVDNKFSAIKKMVLLK